MEDKDKDQNLPDETNLSLAAEFWEFVKHRKRYWLLPIVIVLLTLSLLIVFTQGSAVAPFIYTLF
ncbi:MAG: hypothetical protein HZB23_07090 [Deltaproteobacteria bacterium]|nr:hypothetical protein [Deltaproteobacteria bacterium]